jgi:hypothetical protein
MTTAQLGVLAVLTWAGVGVLAWVWLRQRRRPRGRPRLREYVTEAQPQPAPVYVETPQAVLRLREERRLARTLLRRHYTGRNTSRRACMADGALSDRKWRRANTALHAAGCLYNGARTHRTWQEAQNTLNRYYETHEALAWRSAGYVTPR